MRFLKRIIFSVLVTPCFVANSVAHFEIGGVTETVLNVSNIETYQNFFEHSAGWEQRYNGDIKPEQLRSWGISGKTSEKELLMANPESKDAFIRLLQLSGVKQRQIRSNDQSWDTGDIFDLSYRYGFNFQASTATKLANSNRPC